jgi:hypothetical protein
MFIMLPPHRKECLFAVVPASLEYQTAKKASERAASKCCHLTGTTFRQWFYQQASPAKSTGAPVRENVVCMKRSGLK